MSALPRLELITIGAPTARVNGAAATGDVLWRKHLGLLVYLALSPGMVRARSHLLGLLWPEKDGSKSRHSLNEALRRLRASLGAERLITRGDMVALNPAELDVDVLSVHEFETGSTPGLLLDGFQVEDAPAFEEWLETERARYRAQTVSRLLALGQDRLGDGRHPEARGLAHQVLALDGYAEPGIRLAMRAAALSGDAAGALAEFHAFASSLERMGEAPSRELDALAQRIRDGRWREAAARVATAEPPLVGRESIQRELIRWISPGRTGGATVLLSGEPGMGKTRLQSEAAARLALEGAAVSIVRPIESDQGTNWSALRLLLRRELLAAPGLAATDPRQLATLGSIVPELAARVSPREPRDQAEVAVALTALLRAVAEEVPVVIGIDQAHLADGATLRTLRVAMEGLSHSRVSLLLTAVPSDPDTPRELLELQAEIGRSLSGAVIDLGPLDHAALLQLVGMLAPWCIEAAAQDRLVRRLLVETGGRPFLVTTLLRGLAEGVALRERAVVWPPPDSTFESPLPVEVPQLIRSAVLAQVARLDAESRQVLVAASTGGQVLDLALLSSLAGAAASDLPGRLATLERHHFVVLESNRYAFASPLIPAVIERDMLTPGQVRDLRQRTFDLLTGRPDLEARALRAEMQVRLSPSPDSCEELLRVAVDALSGGDRRLARRALAFAEDVATNPDHSTLLNSLREQLDSTTRGRPRLSA